MPTPLDALPPAERRRRVIRSDWMLAVLAALGFLLYVTQYRAQDPGSTVRYFESDALIDTARRWVRENGYDVTGLTPEVRLRRNVELLDLLQRRLGRHEAIAVLQSPQGDEVPAYRWEVVWTGPDSDGNPEDKLRVHLTQMGAVYGFQSESGLVGFRQRNREAIRARVRAYVGDESAPPSPSTALGRDTLLERRLPLSDSLRRVAEEAFGEAYEQLDGGVQPLPPRIPFDSTAAATMARYHLEKTALGAERFELDSLWFARGTPVTARFRTTEQRTGNETNVTVEYTPLGVLVALRPDFISTPVRETHSISLGDEAEIDDPDDARELNVQATVGTGVGIYVLLVLVFVVTFFRRLSARTIDTSAAMRDALLFGSLGGAAIFMGALPGIQRNSGAALEVWQPYLFAGLSAVFVGMGIGVLIFMISGATDSMAREPWPRKLRTITLVRQLTVRNRPVGRALLRGLALALIANGTFVLFLMLVPQSRLLFEEQMMGYDRSLSYFVELAARTSWNGFLQLAMVLLGVGVYVYRRRPDGRLVVSVATILLGLLIITPHPIAPFGLGLLSSTLLALVFTLVFWRYDFLTCLVGFVLYHVLWSTSPGWAIEGSPMWIDAGLAYTTLGLVGLTGFVGVRSTKTGDAIPQYVPDYILELSKQERMSREIEIARQVQASFLPHRMPDIDGLDLAAMCLAAQEVGGDYYDFVQLTPTRTAIIIGDVSGKGIQAAFYMTLAKGFFRTLCREIESPAEVLRRMNRLFWENSERGTFISVIYGILDLDARTFTFARAGHNPVILKRSPSQYPDLMQPAGLALGLIADARFDRTIEERVINLRTGDVLVFYTDGFSEAMNSHKQLYGDQRLADKVAEFGQLNADGILRVVSEDVHRFVEQAGRFDDMTMVVAKIGPPLDGGTARAQVKAAVPAGGERS